MKIQATKRGGRAFTWVELLVVIGVLALVAALLLPFLKRSKGGPISRCPNNLREIGIACRIWAGDNGDKYPMEVSVTNGGAMELARHGNLAPIFQVMSNELNTPKLLLCPADAKHVAATSFSRGFSDANISYFLNLDVNKGDPQMILAGDDNFAINGKLVQPGILYLSTNVSIAWTDERHRPSAGNIALADGSVQSITTLPLCNSNKRFTKPMPAQTNLSGS